MASNGTHGILADDFCSLEVPGPVSQVAMTSLSVAPQIHALGEPLVMGEQCLVLTAAAGLLSRSSRSLVRICVFWNTMRKLHEGMYSPCRPLLVPAEHASGSMSPGLHGTLPSRYNQRGSPQSSCKSILGDDCVGFSLFTLKQTS